MPSNHSARLDLPYLAAGQLQKHVTVNEALTRLDVLAQTAVVSRSVSMQPGDPEDGDLYILPDLATGSAWAAWHAGDLARAELGGWTRVPVPVGTQVVVLDEAALVIRGESGWQDFPTRLQGLTRLGLNATADAGNPFAAKLNKALWTALSAGEGGDGDLRFTFNKDAPADSLSLLFQTGYQGRAELGLVGDDDLRLKVSPDGSDWREALRIDRGEGRVWFPRGAARAETTRLTTGGDYSPPDWARLLIVTAIGGGGGGATGAFGASGARLGGGGGGGGGLSQATWRVEDLPGDLIVTIGAGGVAGSNGGSTVVTAAGATLMTARGGGAGQAAGVGGNAGLGIVGGNAGGGSSASATASVGQSQTCPSAPGGGGGGGSLDAANVARAGGDGGIGGLLSSPANGGAGGVAAVGQVGGAPVTLFSASGGGGGGAGAVTSGAGRAGGSGGGHGAGGGGGGAGVTAGGAGGVGSGGIVLILAQG